MKKFNIWKMYNVVPDLCAVREGEVLARHLGPCEAPRSFRGTSVLPRHLGPSEGEVLAKHLDPCEASRSLRGTSVLARRFEQCRQLYDIVDAQNCARFVCLR